MSRRLWWWFEEMLDEKVKSNVIEAYVKHFEDYAKTSDVERVYEDTVAQMQRIDLRVLQNKTWRAS
ncbi:MAG: hypothetical protein QXP36_01230 [Conexivisphaerales archaeon]